jgi:hypothetical protein
MHILNLTVAGQKHIFTVKKVESKLILRNQGAVKGIANLQICLHLQFLTYF